MATGEAYLKLVRQLPCCVCGARQDVVAHHATGGGMGTKKLDSETFPLCQEHHRNFHDLAGRFRGWDKARLRGWQDDMVDQTQRLLTKETKDG